jgi:hypothetical protein
MDHRHFVAFHPQEHGEAVHRILLIVGNDDAAIADAS